MVKEIYIYTPNGEITRYKVGDEMIGYGDIHSIEVDNEDGLARVYINITDLEGKLLRGWIMTAGLPYSAMS